MKSTQQNLRAMGQVTDRWRETGRGKPVWMVLQAFSWHKVRPESNPRARYPAFHESRFMAYDALVHGARGLLFWGSETIDQPGFRHSFYALTAELAKLQPFLVVAGEPEIQVRLIEAQVEGLPTWGVRGIARRHGDEWLVVLVNEDDRWHKAVEVAGLSALNGRLLSRLYGPETIRIERGELLTHMQAHEVQVFATGRQWESTRQEGRDFGE